MLCHYVCYVTMRSLNMCIALFEYSRFLTFKDFSVRSCSISSVRWRLQWRAAAMGSWTRSMKQLPIWRRRKVWKWTCYYVVEISRQWGMRKTWSAWQYQQSTEQCRRFTSKSFGFMLSCILAQNIIKTPHNLIWSISDIILGRRKLQYWPSLLEGTMKLLITYRSCHMEVGWHPTFIFSVGPASTLFIIAST